MFSSAKHPVLTGTAILTCAGTLSRLIGFFYRIFLSRTIGAQGLGIYQMIFPVYAFCLSGVTAGIQSALSRCCSAALSKGNPRKGWVFFLSGSGLSVGLSLIVSFFLYTRAPWISLHILHEIRCCELLQLLAFSLPLCSIHICIHAWYFSTRRTTVPAVSQLLEQFARVGASYVIYLIFLEQNLAPTPILAVGGMLFGELAACFFCVVCLAFQKPSYKGTTDFRVRSCLWEILTLSVPLTLNRMLVNLLQSTEAILIPGKLEASGLTNAQSLSLYGALTGMALPLFYFLLRSRPPSPRCSSQPSPDSRQPEKKMPSSALPNRPFNTVCGSAFYPEESSSFSEKSWHRSSIETRTPASFYRSWPFSARSSTSPPP